MYVFIFCLTSHHSELSKESGKTVPRNRILEIEMEPLLTSGLESYADIHQINEMDYSKINSKDQERFHFHRGDLTKEGECDEVVRICVAKYG